MAKHNGAPVHLRLVWGFTGLFLDPTGHTWEGFDIDEDPDGANTCARCLLHFPRSGGPGCGYVHRETSEVVCDNCVHITYPREETHAN